MIDLEQMTAYIAHGGPVPRILTVRRNRNGVVEMCLALGGNVPPGSPSDHLIFQTPELANDKIRAYARRFMRLESLEQAWLADVNA